MSPRTGRVLREGSRRREFCQGCNARETLQKFGISVDEGKAS